MQVQPEQFGLTSKIGIRKEFNSNPSTEMRDVFG